MVCRFAVRHATYECLIASQPGSQTSHLHANTSNGGLIEVASRGTSATAEEFAFIEFEIDLIGCRSGGDGDGGGDNGTKAWCSGSRTTEKCRLKCKSGYPVNYHAVGCSSGSLNGEKAQQKICCSCSGSVRHCDREQMVVIATGC